MKKIIILTVAIIVLIAGLILAKHNLLAAGSTGNYLVLAGGYVKTTLLNSTSPSGFSFEGWVFPDSLSGQQKILSIGDKSNSQISYEIGINGGSLQLYYRFGTGGTKIITAGNLPSGNWVHIATTINSSSTKLYINGISVFTTTGETGLKQIGPNIVLGGSYLESSGNPGAYKGLIDDVRISNEARSVESLWSNGNYGLPLTVDGNTILLWHLDEARGIVVTQDASSNNLDGTLIGGDSKVHFFGILPTNTPFQFPTLGWTLPILPTIHRLPIPTLSNPPGDNPLPTSGNAFPSPTNIRDWPRPTRPVFRY